MTGLCAVILFVNLHAEHILRNAGELDELQARIKNGGRNNHLRYADDTRKQRRTKELLMRMKEETERAGLKTKY